MIGIDGIMIFRLDPGRLIRNLQITHVDRNMIFQISMIMFHVNLQGCKGIICCHFVRFQEWFLFLPVSHTWPKQPWHFRNVWSFLYMTFNWHCATSWSMRIWFTFTFKLGRSLRTAEFDLEPAFLCVFFCCSSSELCGFLLQLLANVWDTLRVDTQILTGANSLFTYKIG